MARRQSIRCSVGVSLLFAVAALASPPPLITITRLAHPPTIDGSIDEDEWADASGTTGFFELGTGRQAERQTEVRLGFDEECLYVAFLSRQDSLLLREGLQGRNLQFASDMEGFELWVQPPGKGSLQLLGVPAGGLLGNREDHTPGDWLAAVRFASKVEDSGEMMGGTLTYGKKTWTGEIAMPFAAAGVSAPADGELWRLNVCRDFSVAPGQARLPADWTTWAPLQSGFAEVTGFGHARFSRSGPVFRLASFGDLSSGRLELQGSGGGGLEVLARVLLADETEKPVCELRTALAEAGRFQLQDSVRAETGGVTAMRLSLTARDTVQATIVAQAEIPFELRPSLWLQPRLFYSARRLQVTVDATRLANLTDAGSVEVSLWSGAGPETLAAAQGTLEPTRSRVVLDLDIAKVAPGRYGLRGRVRNRANDVLATAAESVQVPERPPWLGNDLGLTGDVPPPFSPVTVEGNRAAVVLREYLLENSGLPGSVVSVGEDLLAAPASLTAVINGKQESWQFEPLAASVSKPQAAEWRIAGASRALELRGLVRVEFDGLGVWGVTVTPKAPVAIDHLYLDFPIKREHALFAKGDGSVVASLLQDRYTQAPGREDVITLGNRVTEWGSWSYSRKGWAWPEKFCNEIYVGSDRRGFAVMTETDENVVGPRYAEFITGPATDVVLLRINLVSARTTVAKPLVYRYLWQTTPLKPEPRDPKVWHVGFDPCSVYTSQVPGYASEEGKRFLSALYVGQAYYDLDPDGYPRWVRSPQESVAGLRAFQGLGLKLVHNLWYAAIATRLPEYQMFGAEWDAVPKYGWPSPNASLTSACQASAYQDFSIWCTERIVNELGFDGVYTDTTAVPCQNAFHGCGYVGRDGKQHSTLNLLATRRFAKRLYAILKSGGRDRLNFAHSGESTSAGAFVDIRTHGEELIQEEKDHYRRLSPDYFRAKYAQNEYGVPYTFYAVFHYKWRAVGETVPLNEILMMCLVHRVTLGVAYDLEMLPVWRLFDDWWTAARFIPYWRDDCPSRTSDPLNVLASTFLKAEQRKALIVVANWSYGAATAGVTVDWAKAGFGPVPLKLVDVPSGNRVDLGEGSVTLAIPARDYRVLIAD
jgi:hypothetical protein